MRWLLPVLFVLPTISHAQEYIGSVYFDTAKWEVKSADDARLKKLIKKIDGSSWQIVIVGHTDTRGSATYNFQLAKKRAKALGARLKKLGMKRGFLLSLSYGEQKASQDKSNSRRADIIALHPDILRSDNKKNRLILLGGIGPQGLDSDGVVGSQITVNQSFNPVVGVGYMRMLDDRWSVGGAVFTNLGVFLNLGYDF